MAFFDASAAKFFIDDTGSTEREMTAYIDSVSGLPGPRDLNDVTSLADTGRKFIPGLENVVITIDGHFDDTATSGPDVVFGALRTHTSAVDFNYGPEGNTVGDPKYSGTCWVTNYDITSRVGSQVRFTVTLQVEGTITTGTY